jgi:hypothetical protein
MNDSQRGHAWKKKYSHYEVCIDMYRFCRAALPPRQLNLRRHGMKVARQNGIR